MGGNPGSEAWALRSLAGLHAMVGRFELARTLLAEANAIFEELGQTLILLGFASRRRSSSCWPAIPAPPKGASAPGYRALEEMGDRAFLPDDGRVPCRRRSTRRGATRTPRRSREISEQLAARDDLLTQVVWRRVRAKVIAQAGSHRRGRSARAGGRDDQRVDRLPQHPRRRSRRSRPRSIGERAAWTKHAQLSRRALLSTRRRATAWPLEQTRAHLAVLQQT